MRHQIFKPHQDLATLFKCYWTLDNPQKKTIVPDGCVKIIFTTAIYINIIKKMETERKVLFKPRLLLHYALGKSPYIGKEINYAKPTSG